MESAGAGRARDGRDPRARSVDARVAHSGPRGGRREAQRRRSRRRGGSGLALRAAPRGRGAKDRRPGDDGGGRRGIQPRWSANIERAAAPARRRGPRRGSPISSSSPPLAPAFPGGASVCGGALESAANLVAWLPLAGGDGAGENATFPDASGHGHDGFPVGAYETASVDFAAHPVVRDVTPAGGSTYSKPARNGTAACAPWGAYDGCVEGDWGCTECLSGAGFDLGECGNKARGGAVSFADGFTIHTFKENGVFEVLRRDLGGRVLVVGGGGGGRVGADGGANVRRLPRRRVGRLSGGYSALRRRRRRRSRRLSHLPRRRAVRNRRRSRRRGRARRVRRGRSRRAFLGRGVRG